MQQPGSQERCPRCVGPGREATDPCGGPVRVQGAKGVRGLARASAGAQHARARRGAHPGPTEVHLPIAGDCDCWGSRSTAPGTGNNGRPDFPPPLAIRRRSSMRTTTGSSR
jgi:hypothetical protein